MKRYQTGEVMLVVMGVMLAVVWLGSGHVCMMGHGATHVEESGKAEPPRSSASEEPPEHRR